MSKIVSTIFKYIVLLAIVGYLVFVAVKVIRPSGDMVCSGIEVRLENNPDSTFVNAEGVERVLSAHKIEPVGQPLKTIDTKMIDSLLMDNPYIDSVVSYPTSSGRLCIRIITSRPLLHIIPNDAKEFYLESSGKALPCGGQNANLCVVTGNVTQQYARDNLITLGEILRDDAYWKLQAQQINITFDGKIQLVPRLGNHILELGDSHNIADKLDRIRVFYEQEMPRVGWNTYKTISAEFDGQLVCTRE